MTGSSEYIELRFTNERNDMLHTALHMYGYSHGPGGLLSFVLHAAIWTTVATFVRHNPVLVVPILIAVAAVIVGGALVRRRVSTRR